MVRGMERLWDNPRRAGKAVVGTGMLRAIRAAQ